METSHHSVKTTSIEKATIALQTAERRQTEAKSIKHNSKITQKSLLISVTFHSSNEVWSSDLFFVNVFTSPSSSTQDII